MRSDLRRRGGRDGWIGLWVRGGIEDRRKIYGKNTALGVYSYFHM